MLKFIFVALLALGLLAGCVQYKDGNPVAEAKTQEVVKEEKPNGTLEEALKEFKNVKVKDVTDARESTGYIYMVIELDEDQGARSQAGGVVAQSENFIKALKDKPKTVGINVLYEGVKVLQFTKEAETGKITLDMSHPDIEDYLKKAQLLK
ncbi:MAG: hypothetical protein ACE3JP_03370 [Ectobacillus sp.]